MARILTPRQLRRALVGWGVLALPIVVVVLAVVLFGTRPLERTLIDFLVLGLYVVSLQVFVGNSGILSFGHAAFAGIGAYAAALVSIPPAIREAALPNLPAWLATFELGLWSTLALAALLCVIVALVVGGALTRMRELAMAVATLALLVVMHSVFVNWDTVTRGTTGLFGIPVRTTIWVALGALLLYTLIARIYKESRAGLRVQGTREDPLSAAALGVNVSVSRLVSWILSAVMMGVAGALFAQKALAFDPDQFYFTLTFTTLSMLVIGGRASVTGAVAGVALVEVVSEFLRGFEGGGTLGPISLPELPGVVQITIAVMIIVVLVFRPSGLFGRWELDELLLRARRGLSKGAPAPEVGGAAVALPEPGEPVLVADGIVKDFQGLRALGGVDLVLRRREILGLIGPNGSGKTTLLNVLSGVLPPTSGRITLDGADVTRLSSHRVARLGMARTFQNIRLFPGLTVRENLETAADAKVSDADVDAVLARFALTPHQHQPVGGLAYGIQRRVEIARAVVRRPSVLLLDEPAAGMNETESEDLLRMIAAVRAELDCSVVVIDHDLRLIMRLCHRIHVLNEGGTVTVGPPHEVSSDPRVIEAYLGTERPPLAEV
jgi:branched-chain amino acid transport system permease protein